MEEGWGGIQQGGDVGVLVDEDGIEGEVGTARVGSSGERMGRPARTGIGVDGGFSATPTSSNSMWTIPVRRVGDKGIEGLQTTHSTILDPRVLSHSTPASSSMTPQPSRTVPHPILAIPVSTARGTQRRSAISLSPNILPSLSTPPPSSHSTRTVPRTPSPTLLRSSTLLARPYRHSPPFPSPPSLLSLSHTRSLSLASISPTSHSPSTLSSPNSPLTLPEITEHDYPTVPSYPTPLFSPHLSRTHSRNLTVTSLSSLTDSGSRINAIGDLTGEGTRESGARESLVELGGKGKQVRGRGWWWN